MERLVVGNLHFRFGVLSTIERMSSQRLFSSLRNNSLRCHGTKNAPAVCLHWRTLVRNLHVRSRSPQHSKALRLELRALSSLLRRSGLLHNGTLLDLQGQHRQFGASVVCCSEEKHKKTEKKETSKQEKNKNSGKQNDGDDENEDIEQIRTLYQSIFMTAVILLFVLLFASALPHAESFLTWNEFFNEVLLKGEVKSVVINKAEEVAYVEVYPEAVINGQKVTYRTFKLKITDPDKFEVKVRDAEREHGIKAEDAVPIKVVFEHGGGERFITTVVLLTFLLLPLLMALLRRGPGSMEMMDPFKTATKFVRGDIKLAESGGVTFKDVAGLKEAKIEIMEFVEFLKNPERFQELGAKVPHGSLLLGPPGCGKTLLAKAVATEAEVPFLAMAGSEFIEMIGGVGAARVRDLFKEARKCAPCIVYIDEIDSIGKKRSGSAGGPSENDQTLNQLLVEMDGMDTTKGVIVMASTNIAKVLDKALLRPGRFDRHIMIDYPTRKEREEMFEMYLKKLTLAKSFGSPEAITRLAHLTPGMTGADIANVCNEAALHAARYKKKEVEGSDFEYAVERVVAGVAKKTGVLSQQEKKVIAYHESGHALVGWMMKETDALLKITIVPRTSAMLGFAQYVPSSHMLVSSQQLFEKMCMALGGRAAESIIFNRVTTGAQNDLKEVTKMAYNQIRAYGMNEVVGHLSFPSSSTEMGAKPYSNMLGNIIDQEARMLVTKAYRTAEQTLLDNKDKLHDLANKLLEKETLMYEEVETIIGPPPHGRKNIIDLSDVDRIPRNDMDNDNGDNGDENKNERANNGDYRDGSDDDYDEEVAGEKNMR